MRAVGREAAVDRDFWRSARRGLLEEIELGKRAAMVDLIIFTALRRSGPARPHQGSLTLSDPGHPRPRSHVRSC
jgi:hypothetical protein